MSEIKVNSIKGVSASTAAISIDNSSGSASANLTAVNSVVMPNGGFLSNKNIIINGAMQCAQYGASDSTTNGNGTVDRFQLIRSGVDENPTQSHADVASGTTPYTLGFRRAFKVLNGNQTSVGTSDYITMRYKIEAQDIANSGWNYVSSSSYITFSFWVKSSVAQNFYGYFKTSDGTAQMYSYETGSLTANTWTKVTKTIAGNSNLQFDNDNGIGLEIYLSQFWGTDRTGSVSLDAWRSYNGAARTPDFTSTWYTTDNATFEITGVQLEVGNVATDFEHRSFGQELALCKRYFQTSFTSNPSTTNTSNNGVVLHGGGRTGDTTSFIGGSYVQLSPAMRAAPTVTTFDLAVARNTNKCHRHTYGFTGSNDQPVTITDVNINSFVVRSDSGNSANGLVYHWKCEGEL